jgi:hypothetical protein
MGILRLISITVVVIVAAAGGGYYMLPPTASATKTFTVARPAETVFVYLASTPPGAPIAKGVTQTEVASAAKNIVVANVAFAGGTTGTATYTISPQGDGTEVALKIDQPLGPNPVGRIRALVDGKVKPLVEAAATTITTQIGHIKATSFSGLRYSVVELLAQPFFYIENCTTNKSGDITSIINQAVQVIPPLMRANRLEQVGPLTAVEPRVMQGQYCYQVGYRYTGAKPHALLVGKFGDSPAGTALHVTYTGTEDKVLPEVYDRIDALLAATHLDDPTRTDDDWLTFEVYNDDPTQAGGSHNREIYYVVPPGVDLSRLTAIAPPTAAPPAEATAPTPTPETPTKTPAAASASASATPATATTQ